MVLHLGLSDAKAGRGGGAGRGVQSEPRRLGHLGKEALTHHGLTLHLGRRRHQQSLHVGQGVEGGAQHVRHRGGSVPVLHRATRHPCGDVRGVSHRRSLRLGPLHPRHRFLLSHAERHRDVARAVVVVWCACACFQGGCGDGDDGRKGREWSV